MICGSCGAVLRPIARADDVLESVICAGCGSANAPHADVCDRCGAPLLQVCPRCQAPMPTDAAACGRCGLPRGEFYAESAAIAREGARTRTRAFGSGQLVFLMAGAAFLLIALWHHVHGAMPMRNTAIVMAVLFAVFWAVFRFVR